MKVNSHNKIIYAVADVCCVAVLSFALFVHVFSLRLADGTIDLRGRSEKKEDNKSEEK